MNLQTNSYNTGSVISTISESFVVTFLKQVQIKELENLLENFTFESASGSDMDFICYVENAEVTLWGKAEVHAVKFDRTVIFIPLPHGAS